MLEKITNHLLFWPMFVIIIILAPALMAMAIVQTLYDFIRGGWKAIKEEQ